MGARFAPSVAKMFMVEWEEEKIYQSRPKQLKMYKRYIDDVILIWNGDEESLLPYLNSLTTY